MGIFEKLQASMSSQRPLALRRARVRHPVGFLG